ncbi:MAG: SLC13 family permease, partial [Ignavibacteria bacterium]
ALLFTMIILWITEAIPIPVTALLPAVILPLFNVKGITNNEIIEFNGKNVLANYANPIIFLFLSGFLIARSMQKWNLDRRLTYSILSFRNLADNPSLIILALLLISAFISMWISNTATTAMLLPLVVGIVNITKNSDTKNFSKVLALSIAYGSSIGGIATLIGTPPNGICVSILRTSGNYDINFLEWLKIGLPITFLLIPVTWLLLLKVFPIEIKNIPGGKDYIKNLKEDIGPISKGEKFTLVGFVLLLILWISNPFWNIILPNKIYNQLKNYDENLIALSIAILLFTIPVDWKSKKFVLDWKDSKFVDWGTLFLFGGGIALSDAMFRTGLAGWIATTVLKITGQPHPIVIVLIIIIFMELLTEVTSNTAVTSMMVPILLSISIGLGIDGKLLAIAATLAASMAFMLPVATPPNAIVYGSGFIKITDMVRAGFILDIVAWLIITISLYIFSYLVFEIVKF